MTELKRIFSGNKKPNSETIVLLHGWAMNSSIWQTILPFLETRFRICCIDLPGHGNNANIPMGDIESVVGLLIEALPKECHLLAWSLGGLLGLSLANEIEKRSLKDHHNKLPQLKSVTVVGMSPKFTQSGDWQHAVPMSQLETLYKNLNKDLEKTISSFIYLQFLNVKNTHDIQKKLITSVLKKRPDIASLNSGLDILNQQDLRHVNINPAIPIHWILGAKDKLVPKAVANNIVNLFTKHHVTILDAAAHIPFVTHPKDFLKVYLEFLDS